MLDLRRQNTPEIRRKPAEKKRRENRGRRHESRELRALLAQDSLPRVAERAAHDRERHRFLRSTAGLAASGEDGKLWRAGSPLYRIEALAAADLSE